MTVAELRKALEGVPDTALVVGQVMLDEPEEWEGDFEYAHFETKCEHLETDTLFLASRSD